MFLSVRESRFERLISLHVTFSIGVFDTASYLLMLFCVPKLDFPSCCQFCSAAEEDL